MTVKKYTPPAQFDVPCEMFSTAGWIKGTLMIPKLRNVVDYLNQNHEFLKVKNVYLPGLDKEIPFFAMQKSAIILVLPAPTSEVAVSPASAGERKSREVSCALNSGVVSGSIEILGGVRVSDFLMQNAAFFALTQCSIFLRTGGGPAEVRHNIPNVLVNAPQIIGVSEPRFV